MSHDFAERVSHILLEKGGGYAEYPMLDEQDRVTDYRNSPVASEEMQEVSTIGADSNVDIFPEGVDDDHDYKFDGTIGGEFAQHVFVKHKYRIWKMKVRKKTKRFDKRRRSC